MQQQQHEPEPDPLTPFERSWITCWPYVVIPTILVVGMSGGFIHYIYPVLLNYMGLIPSAPETPAQTLNAILDHRIKIKELGNEVSNQYIVNNFTVILQNSWLQISNF